MGLDVGAVKIRYIEQPRGAAYGFAWNLAAESDSDGWQAVSDGNAFVEFDQDHMIDRAATYISDERLDSADAHQVMRWVRTLPWDNGMIMLHMNW